MEEDQDVHWVNVDDHPYLRHLQAGFSVRVVQLNECRKINVIKRMSLR